MAKIKKLNQTIIEHALRRMPVGKLQALKLFTGSEKQIHASRISAATGLNFRHLGGTVSSLTKTKINHQHIILPVGKSERRTILKLNEKVISRSDLKKSLDNIRL